MPYIAPRDDIEMNTHEVIAAMTRAQRALCAHRWGIRHSGPRVMAELLLDETTAERLLRRIEKAGAGELIRLLAEHPGRGIPVQEELEAEAAIVADWGVLLAGDGRWLLPFDLAVAMAGELRCERFFAAGLIRRLSEGELRTMANALNVTAGGSRVSQIARIARAALEAPVDASLKDAAEACAKLSPLAAAEIDRVEWLEEPPFGRFRVCLRDGREELVCPREYAVALGVSFREARARGFRPQTMELEPIDVPEARLISAVVRFPSRRALDDALQTPRFAELVAERLGDTRAAIASGVEREKLRQVLLHIGFEDARGQDGRHAR